MKQKNIIELHYLEYVFFSLQLRLLSIFSVITMDRSYMQKFIIDTIHLSVLLLAAYLQQFLNIFPKKKYSRPDFLWL